MIRTISALLLFAAAVSLPAHLSGQTLAPAPDQKLAHDIYKEFIEIQSGFTTGATTPVAEAAAKYARAAGFPDSDIYLGGAIPKKFNFVVRLHGTGAKKPLLLLAHIDVVEAKREDWSMEPFQFIEKDGFYYGRGTSDDKAQAAVWLATIIRMKRENFHPDRDIIVALTADEEGGGPYNGVDWLLKNHRNLIESEFALNEGGAGEALPDGKKISNDFQVAEKYVINFSLKVTNKGGHSSLPVPDNAIYHLAGALDRLGKFGFPLKTNEVTAAYFDQMAKLQTGPIVNDLAQVSKGNQAAMEKVAAATPGWNSMLRTTCVATMLSGGHALNALPQLATANINCRVLPSDSPQYVMDTLTKVFADPQVKVTNDEPDSKPGVPSPLSPEILGAVKAATQDEFPGVPVLPVMLTGATDGKYLRSSGIACYGIQGFFSDRTDVRAHGRDERMPIKSFYEGQAFMYDLVKRLATP